MRSVYTAAYQRMLRNLRKAREEAGLTQAQVAKAFKRPQSYVSNCESGERRVDLIEAWEFAQLYGCSVTDFLPK
jgi:transcriptional regulator with XRE-family HTH domain